MLEAYEHLETLHPAPPASAASPAAGEGGTAPISDFERLDTLASGAAGMGEGAGAGAGAGTGQGLELHTGELSADEMHCYHPEAQGPCCSIDQGDAQGRGGASAMLATDSPGAPAAHHPGEVGEAALAPEGAREAGEGAGVQDLE